MSIVLFFFGAVGSLLFPSTGTLAIQDDWRSEVKQLKVSTLDAYLSPSSVDSVMNAISPNIENQMLYLLDSAGKGRVSHAPLEEYKSLKDKGAKMTLVKYRNKGQNRNYENLFLLSVK